MSSNVEIVWSDFASGKIEAPGRYVAPAKFEADTNWPDDAWSVVLEFTQIGRGTARFLADDAPHHLLKRGVIFQMYAGPTLSATVKIL
jgi:hypothetical protein